jgi:hypothetical protein
MSCATLWVERGSPVEYSPVVERSQVAGTQSDLNQQRRITQQLRELKIRLIERTNSRMRHLERLAFRIAKSNLYEPAVSVYPNDRPRSHQIGNRLRLAERYLRGAEEFIADFVEPFSLWAVRKPSTRWLSPPVASNSKQCKN